MTKARARQLELPVMADVNRQAQAGTSRGRQEVLRARPVDTGFHKPASTDDQSIYKAISENYFKAT